MAKGTAEAHITKVTLELEPEEAEQLAALVAFTDPRTPELDDIHDKLSTAYPNVRGRWALKDRATGRYCEVSVVRYPPSDPAPTEEES